MLTLLILGLSIGSFLNVVITRLDKKKGILLGKSECPNCGHRLRWYDLIPVFSFVMLRGKCRYCKRSISRLYPTVEILTAISFAAYLIFRGLGGPGTVVDLLMISGLIAILFLDLRELVIPDKIVFPLIILAFVFFLSSAEILTRLITALILGLVFAIMYLGSHGRWMGLGDAKLVFLIGLTLSYPLGALAVLLSVWTGALVGITLVAAKKATLKTALPLGTFLAAISIIFIIFQNELQKIAQTVF